MSTLEPASFAAAHIRLTMLGRKFKFLHVSQVAVLAEEKRTKDVVEFAMVLLVVAALLLLDLLEGSATLQTKNAFVVLDREEMLSVFGAIRDI